MKSITLKLAWQAESIRLIEAKKGLYADDLNIQKIAASELSFQQKILHRAQYLADNHGIKDLINGVIKTSRLVLFVIVIAAIFFAILSTKTALGNNRLSVNIFTVLVTLLGVHILSFIFWLFSYVFGHNDQAYGLGAFWIWLSTKLNHKSNSHLVSQALVTTLSRQNAFKPMLGCITNGLWLVMLGAAILALLALFSTKSYTFHWETTILSPQVFVGITSSLAWLPKTLGFNVPDAQLINLSGSIGQQTPQAAALWSQWLVAVVLIYGVVIRFVAFVCMFVILKLRLKTLQIDETLIGYTELYNKLMPLSKGEILDAPAPAYIIGKGSTLKTTPTAIGGNALLAIEMPPLDKWPPFNIPNNIIDMGIVDSIEQRKQAIAALMQTTPNKLLIIVDAKQTPDRGSIRLILELMQLAQQSIVLLLEINNDLNQAFSRENIWFSYLGKAGIDNHKIYNQIDLAQQWLID